MPWQTIDLKLIAPNSLASLAILITNLQSALAPIVGSNFPPTFGGVIGGLIAILNTVKVFVTEKNDLVAQFTNLFISDTETIVNDTFNAGVSMLFVGPKPGSFTLTPSLAISQAVASLDDTNDIHRPVISSSGYAAGLGILLTVPDLPSFKNIIGSFKKLISIKEIENLYNSVSKQVDIIQTPKTTTKKSASVPPDWIGYTVKEIIPSFQVVYDATIQFLEELKGASTLTTTSLDNIIQILTDKFTQIANVMINTTNTINEILNLPLLSGIYVLYFAGIGGNNLIKSELQSLNLSTFAGNSYSMFVLMAGGAPSAATFTMFGEMFGLG